MADTWKSSEIVDLKIDFRVLRQALQEITTDKLKAIRNNSDLHVVILQEYVKGVSPFVPYDENKDKRIQLSLKKANRKRVTKKFKESLPFGTEHLRDSYKIYHSGVLRYSAYADNGYNYAGLQYTVPFKHSGRESDHWDEVFASSPEFDKFLKRTAKILTKEIRGK